MLPDLRKFEVSSGQIKSLMKEFNLGKLLNYSLEEGIEHHHSNKIAFVKSDNGNEYVFKFYLNRERPIRFYIQFLVINTLLNKNFRTSRMYLTKYRKPFSKSKDYFVAVYDKLDATLIRYADFSKLDKDKLFELFSTLRAELANIEKKMDFKKYIINDFYKKYNFSTILEDLPTNISEGTNISLLLKKLSTHLSPEKNKSLVCFVHSEVSLKNMLLKNKDYYLVDFDHLGYDYYLQEFGNFVVNLYMHNVKKGLIHAFMSKYITLNKLSKPRINMLLSIISFELIREYVRFWNRLDNLIKDKKSPFPLNKGLQKLGKKGLIAKEKDYLSYLSRGIDYFSNKIS